MDLSVVIPLYNEEESVALLVTQVLEAVRPLGLQHELLVVDDGSSDGTAAAVASLVQEVPELVSVRLRRNSTSASSRNPTANLG